MAEINKINIGGVEYDIASSGSGSSITVINKTFSGTQEEPTIVEGFTEEELDTLLSGSAVVRLNMNNIQFVFLTPIFDQQLAEQNTKGIALKGLVNPEDFIYLFVNVVKYGDEESVTTEALTKGISGGTEIKSITLSASTATQGTITSSDLATLQENDQNYIIFNDEIFRLNDKQHESGYLVYSHNGHDTTGCFFQKCITITISTLGWVLESQENASKTYVDNAIGTALQGDY